MRAVFILSVALLLSADHVRSGAIYRQYRELNEESGGAAALLEELDRQPAVSVAENYVSELRKDEIPVQVIEILEPVVIVKPVESLRRIEPALEISEKESNTNEIIAGDAINSGSETIAEVLAEAVKEEQKVFTSLPNLLIAERQLKANEKVILDEIKEENKELLASEEEVNKNALKNEKEDELVVVVPEKAIAKEPVVVIVPETEENFQLLRGLLPVKEALVAPAESVPVKDAVQISSDPQPSEKQSNAANPSPAAATTSRPPQPGFIQQLVQPLGQFLSNIGGVQQQSAAATGDVAAAPPTIASNLLQTIQNNTSQFATSLQQGIQQQFMGLQQQLQSTFNIPGVQQSAAGTPDATTLRPPGPIQSFVSTFLGGGAANQQAASPPAPQQANNPLQGILNLFNGGNRPQAAAAAAPVAAASTAAAVDANASTDATSDGASTSAVSSTVDDKIDSNNVRQSGEVLDSIEDSQEKVKPEGLIVVNDDTPVTSE